MLITRPALALTVTCMLSVPPLTAAFGADVTIPVTATQTKEKRIQREDAKAATGNHGAATRKRPENKRHHKISTYSLLSDSPFRHGTGISGKPRYSSPDMGMGLGTGLHQSPLRGTAPDAPKNKDRMPLGSGYRTDDANSASATVDCREKASPTSPGRREMTACFVHKLDRSWKTQTYVSRRSADGNTAWGGGLAVGYDY